jgi:hypothetical protein
VGPSQAAASFSFSTFGKMELKNSTAGEEAPNEKDVDTKGYTIKNKIN